MQRSFAAAFQVCFQESKHSAYLNECGAYVGFMIKHLMNYSVCLFSSTAHHSHPALCSCRQNMKDHPPPIPFGWSWPTEDLIRVSDGRMKIKTVSLTLTPLLWVEGRVGGLPLAGHIPWFNSAVPSLGQCLCGLLTASLCLWESIFNSSMDYPNLQVGFPAGILKYTAKDGVYTLWEF